MTRIAPATPRRARHALGALVALVLIAPLLLAGAADAVVAVGTQLVTGWSVGPKSATVRFPGDGAALDPLRADLAGGLTFGQGGSGANVYPLVSVDNAGFGTLTAGCLSGAATGELRRCGTAGTITLTFPRPVADPVLHLALPGIVHRSAAGSCTLTTTSMRVTKVNGATPPADSPVAVGGGDGPYVWDQATKRLSVPPVGGPEQGECDYRGVGNVLIGVSGLVTSVDIDLDVMATITTADRDGAAASNPGPGYALVRVPVADLLVTTDAESQVDAAGQITWDVDVRNAGGAGSHGFVVHDAVPAEVVDASVVTAPAGCALDGRDLVCPRQPAGCTVSENALADTLLDLTCPATMRDADAIVLAAGASFGDITLTGTAPAGRGTVVTSTARVAGVDFDTNVANNVASVDTEVVAPTLTVAARLDARVAPADQLTVSAAADGTVVAAATTSGTDLSAASAPVQVTRDQAYTITQTTAPGSVTELSRYGGRLVCTDDTGATAPADGTGPWTFTPTENRAYTCVVTNAVLSHSFTVQKSASVETATPGGTVGYELTVTNTGTAPYTAADPAVLVDDLSAVLDDATPTGTVTGGAELDGSTLRWRGALAPGASATITYAVRVHDTFTGDRTLLNTVTTPPGSGGSCPAAAAGDPASAGCSTSTPVEATDATVLVEKVGDGPQGVQRLAGASFEVLADDAGAPGTPLAAGTEHEAGLVAFDVLAPGTYWLREAVAPSSFALLAEPVRFTVAPSGVVSVSDPQAHPQVTVTGPASDTLTVQDVAALGLPSAGGAGTTLLLVTAGVLLVLAAAAAAVHVRRSRPDTSRP